MSKMLSDPEEFTGGGDYQEPDNHNDAGGLKQHMHTSCSLHCSRSPESEGLSALLYVASTFRKKKSKVSTPETW